MDFFERTGRLAIGSRLRMLTDRITTEAGQAYAMAGLDVKPKWFPVLFELGKGECGTITGIAREIGQSHPSVSNIVKELERSELVIEVVDNQDRRRTVIKLSPKGERVWAKVEELCLDMSAAVESLSAESGHDLWWALADWEEALGRKSLIQRVKEARRERERAEVELVPYEEKYHGVFRRLNEDWIQTYWQLEESDNQVLGDPQANILDKGGHIIVALYRGEPVGVCALQSMPADSPFDFEMAKLAVAPEAKGKGIGLILCEAVIEKARSFGAKKLFLESNTILTPAITLYKKLGFKEIRNRIPGLHDRGNIQMQLDLH